MHRFSINLLFLCLNFYNLSGQSQPANGWVDYKKQYLKIEIDATGIYRITHQDLKSAGFESFKNIVCLHHGNEVKIKTFLELNNSLLVKQVNRRAKCR